MDLSRIHTLQHASYLQGLLSAWVESCGIRLFADTDFDRLAYEYKIGTGRDVYPVFDPQQSDICAQTGFVIRGEDTSGRVVHLQAFRLWDLQNSTLTKHFQRHIRLYCALDEKRISFANTVVSRTNCDWICGRVAYHGQIWLHKEWRGRAVVGMPLGREILPRIGIILAYLAMRPDYLFGLSSYPTAEKGMPSSYGFYHNDLAALAFRDKEENVLWHETVSYLSATEVGDEIRRTLDRCAMDKTARPFLPAALRTRPGLTAAVSA